MQKKQIAVIGLKGLPAFGGAATVGENLIEQLSDKFEFEVYSTASHTHLASGPYKTFHQIVFSAIRNKRLNTLLYYIKSALHAFFIGKYDLIHLHHSDAAFILLLLRLRYKVIVTTHGTHNLGLLPKWEKYKFFFRIQIKYFLGLANQIICVSRTEANWLFYNYGLNTKYIPNGITPGSIETIDDTYSIFFGAGRIIESKGCDLLLKELNEISYNGRIAIAGDLDQSPDYREYVMNLANNLKVDFLGLIKDKNQLLQIIKSSSLFVYPTQRESMSMMLLEAASVKTPIICSNIEENREIFTDEEVLYFSLDKSGDLYNKINWAQNNYNSMVKKADNAFNKLVTSYNWKNISSEYRLLYNNLIK